MIIPVRCFTCGEVIGDKYLYYLKKIKELKLSRGLDEKKVIYLTEDNIKKTSEGEVLDELGMENPCCRRHFLAHVDIE